MSDKSNELVIIQELSRRLVEAQRQIRILDSIKWDESVRKYFFENKAKVLPLVDVDYYKKRALPYDVHEKKEEFRQISRDAHNLLGQYSPVTRLIKRQSQEYGRALDMLAARGTADFSYIAKELYGSPDDAFYTSGPKLSELGTLLFDTLTTLDIKLQSAADIKQYTALQTQEILQQKLDNYFDQHPGRVTVMVSDEMISDASAGADMIKLSQQAMFSERDIKYLEVHEGWVHVGTTLNGALQPHCFFLSKGSPSSAVLQEGLAVLTEVLTFSSFPGRVLKITNRVIAVDKVLQGANFIDIYNYFLDCGLSEDDSYNNTVRIFRGSTPEGGPFTKDLVYAKGFVLAYNFIRFAISQHRIEAIALLFVGKLTLEDLPLLRELYDQQLLTAPAYLPTPFRDLAALSAWMSFSLYLNKINVPTIQKDLQFLLG